MSEYLKHLLKPNIILSIVVIILLFRNCEHQNNSNTTIIKRDTIYQRDTITIKIDSLVYLTKHTKIKVPTFDTITEYIKQFDTLFIAYNDTNVYNIDTADVVNRIEITQNKINSYSIQNNRATKIINTNSFKPRNQLLYGIGLQNDLNVNLGVSIRLKKGSVISYQYGTDKLHKISYYKVLRLRK